MPLTIEIVAAALTAAGLTPRGAFHPVAADGVPEVAPGRPAATLVLAGNAGPAIWQAFAAERDPDKDTLDNWSKAKLDPLAAELGGSALYPFEPPYLPFQRWATRAEACRPSPLGMFIHPDYGLWHGYRGAIVLAEKLALPPGDSRPSRCDDCEDKPCLATCPVGAFTAKGYDVSVCAAHLATDAGTDCMGLGCRARRACPAGREYTYAPAQAAFHMKAFLAAHRHER